MGAVESSLFVEYQDLHELLIGVVDPLDGHGHCLAAMSKYSASTGSAKASGVNIRRA